MPRTSSALLTALSLGVLALSAQAEPRQFGNVIYDLPSGWYPGRDDEGTQVILSELPNDRCEFCYIYIAASQPATGNLARFVSDQKARFVDEDDRDSIQVMSDPEIITSSGVDAAMMAIRFDTDIQVLFAYDVGDRYELVAFEGYASDDEELRESLSTLQTDVVEIFDTLEFISAGGRSLLPDPVPGQMDGIWWGTELVQLLGIDMTMRMDVDHTVLSFWPDGYFLQWNPAQRAGPD